MAEADYRLLTEATGQRIAEALENVSAMVGPPGEVSEAELTAKLADKASAIVDTASGAIASFPDGAAVPAKDITIGIEPVQDLHGYENPWPAGGGKNLLPFTSSEIKRLNIDGTWSGDSYVQYGITYTLLYDNAGNVTGISLNGTASDVSSLILSPNHGNLIQLLYANNLSAMLNGCPSGGSTSTYYQSWYRPESRASYSDTGNGTSVVTPDQDTAGSIVIIVASGVTVSNIVFKPMIRLSSETDATFAPYSNICPISGWTGANVVVSPTTDAQDGTTYSISWQSEAGTVYGGTLDVTTGLLTVDRAMVDMGTLTWEYSSYRNGHFWTQLSGKRNDTTILSSIYPYKGLRPSTYTSSDIALWQESGQNDYVDIFDPAYGTDVNALKAALSGQMLVYELATPQTCQLTPIEIEMLLGDNNVWADTGDSTVAYRADTKLYIQKINAPTDDDMIADAQIASGKYFIVGGNLYRSTTTIPAGDTINPGSNCIMTNLADALNALNT